MFEKNLQSSTLVCAASGLIILGVFFKRIWLLFTSFITPDVYGAPGIISGSSAAAHAQGVDSFAVLSSYAPTAIEVFVVIGVVSLGVLAFMALTGWLIQDKGSAEAEGQAAAAPANA